MSDQKIVVIGGGAAGPKTAAKLRRLNPNAEVTILQKSEDFSMASCGYPYYVGGVFDDRKQLICTPTGVVRDPKFFLADKGIIAKKRVEVTAIDRKAKQVTARELDTGEYLTVAYDKLVIATGASPIKPPVPGSDLKGISTLQSMDDADFLRKVRDEGQVKKAVVVGGGLIGMETCEALHMAGIHVTVIEMLPQIFPFLDPQLAELVKRYVTDQGTTVITSNPVAEFLGTDGQLTGVKLKNGTELDCQLAVVSVGVRPNSQLAKEAGLDLADKGGVAVDQFMQTSDPDIYAAGDCVQINHMLTGKPVFAPFGDLANLQGRVAAQNIAEGNKVKYPGTIQTGICKIFDYTIGTTGLSESAAGDAGFDPVSVVTVTLDKPGFMGAESMIQKMVADKSSGRILGYQAVGLGEISKRIAEVAVAIQGQLTLADLGNADLPYAPPYSQALDAVITTSHVLENKILGRFNGISAAEFKQMLDDKQQMFILDTRDPDEYEQMRLGVGEVLIPLGKLRNNLDKLPQDKDQTIVTYCKISLRGYEAATFLKGLGYTNVLVLEGGLMAWPYAREK